MIRVWFLVMVVGVLLLPFFDLPPMSSQLSIGEEEESIMQVSQTPSPVLRGNLAVRLIFINSTTLEIIAYDPATDTHTPLFVCPDGCYDPSMDNFGRIGFVTDIGFGIYTPSLDDYAQFPADFGVYGYKGGVAFRDDLAYVAYEARFDMNSRLMLMDLSSGQITDLYSAGVGNPTWSSDGNAILSSTGTSLITIPINGDDPITDIIYTPTIAFPTMPSQFYTTMFTDLVTPFGEGLLYRGSNEFGYWLFLNLAGATIEIASAPAIMRYATSESAGMVGIITYDPRDGIYEVQVIDIESKNSFTSPKPNRITSQRTEIFDLALSHDGRYVAWIAENTDLGFGFYDLWITDLSIEDSTPNRIAEAITNSSVRPSGMIFR